MAPLNLPVDGEKTGQWGLKLNAALQAHQDDLDAHQGDLDGRLSDTALSATYARRQRDVYVQSGGDVPAALAAVPAGGRLLLEPGAVFDLTAPLTPPANGVTVEGRGATLRVGAGATGATLSDDQLVSSGVFTDCTLRGITFSHSGVPKTAGTTATATVYVTAARWTVERCTFTGGTRNAVTFSGASATDGRVARNRLTSSSVTLANGGATRNDCIDNIVDTTPASMNAVSVIGNGAGFTEDCRIEGNLILSPSRMGVEESQNTRRTTIRGNRIITPANIGISAVGGSPQVSGNTIVDPPIATAAVEVASDGGRVDGNIVKYATVTPTGSCLIVTGNHGVAEKGATVRGNVLIGPATGIATTGTVSPVAVVGNMIVDHLAAAVSLGGTMTGGSVTGNTVVCNVPGRAGSLRDGIVATATSVGVTVSGNSVSYGASSAGSGFQDYGIRAVAAGTVVVGNTISAGGRADAQRPKIGTGGATPSGGVIANNAVNDGATLDAANMGSVIVGNNLGYRVSNKGTSTIADTTSTIVVTHGLATTPVSVTVTPRGNEMVWVSARTATTFTVSRAGTAGALAFDWQAEL